MTKYGTPLHVHLISTYPPRACGIGTFSRDLRQALERQPGVSTSVFALSEEAGSHAYPGEVDFEIRQHDQDAYREAAEYLNFGPADVINVQHEFGIFGGAEGRYVLDLLERLNKPVVTTLHTVLPTPPEHYRSALADLAARSDGLIVLNEIARRILADDYGVNPAKVTMVHHGVPDVPFVDPNYYKDRFDAEGRTLLLTFGLLSRNKGIEFMLDALPEVVEARPDVLYVVLGDTHPEVKKREGDTYRDALKAQVAALGLEDHVRFVAEYVGDDELLAWLGACDLYVTPYPGLDQISSGTLSYAVGLGKAVVSTPYLHARFLLGDDGERGRLVDYGDAPALSQTLLDLLGDDPQRHRLRKRAYAFGRAMTWPAVAGRYVEVFRAVAAGYNVDRAAAVRPLATRPLPTALSPSLDHLAALTDDTGVFQHATFGVPDRRHGYCTDDVARALAVALTHHRAHGQPQAVALARCYLSFLQHAQRSNGAFHNYMSFDRRWIDETGSEDAQGRALWGLGVTVADAPALTMRLHARELFDRAVAVPLSHPRALGYAVCGLYHYGRRYPGAIAIRRRLAELADALLAHYEGATRDGWTYFSDSLTYANTKPSEALLLAYEVTGTEAYRAAGLATLEFVLQQTWRRDRFDFIGNDGWFHRDGGRAEFAQQPIEAGYTAEACMRAFRATDDARYLDYALAAVGWYFGRNRLGVRLYDAATGACLDGLEATGASFNQGAESVIAYLLGLLAVENVTRLSTGGEVLPGVGDGGLGRGGEPGVYLVGGTSAGDGERRRPVKPAVGRQKPVGEGQ